MPLRGRASPQPFYDLQSSPKGASQARLNLCLSVSSKTDTKTISFPFISIFKESLKLFYKKIFWFLDVRFIMSVLRLFYKEESPDLQKLYNQLG